MAGKVFISCGQRPPDETRIAQEIKEILSTEFSLTSYLAFKIQSLSDIMTITNELRTSDYYLFIDFFRRTSRAKDLAVSLFTHQELALAHNLGFTDIIAFQQNGCPLEGFIKYVLSNPEPFDTDADLLEKIRQSVRAKRWSKDFSRNLVLSEIGFSAPVNYTDHSGSFIERTWLARVENRRPDVAAGGTVCLLDYIIRQSDGKRIEPFDRSYLKWAGQAGYDRTILPRDHGDIDIFSIHADKPGIFLHSLADVPRQAIVDRDGVHTLFFKLFSQGFPLVEFSVEVDLKWASFGPPDWVNNSKATLIL
jgi:hypothetical protein